MKFSHLTVDDLDDWENASAAIPAIPAIPSATDCSESIILDSPVAIPLLFDAIPLLFGTDAQPAPTENSRKIATSSSRIANQESEITQENQTDTEKIAGIAKIAGSENLQNTLTPQQAAALSVLHTLYAQHVDNLKAGGFDGNGALVDRRTYWAGLNKAGIPTDTVFELLDQGRIGMQAEGLYWRPVGEGQA